MSRSRIAAANLPVGDEDDARVSVKNNAQSALAPLGSTTLSDDEWAANPMAPSVRIGW